MAYQAECMPYVLNEGLVLMPPHVPLSLPGMTSTSQSAKQDDPGAPVIASKTNKKCYLPQLDLL